MVRAAVSPSAIAVTGAGVVIGLLLVHSVLVAIALGAGAWLGRMAIFALMRSLPTADPNEVDPYAVSEPWRQYVHQAVAAGQRYDRTIAGWPAGPLRDRVAIVQPRIRQGVQEVWSIARQGAASSTRSGPSVEKLSAELKAVQAQRQQGGADQDALARREEAIAAQLRAARRSEDGSARVLDRLRLLTARLDEAVSQVLELGLDQDAVESVAGTVDGLVDELASLHHGLQQATAEPGLPPGPPT